MNSQILQVIMVMICFQFFILPIPEGKQVETFRNPIDVRNIVPNTPRSTEISVTGQMLFYSPFRALCVTVSVSCPIG